MSKLRPECGRSTKPATVRLGRGGFYSIYRAVARRRSLAYGALHADGKHCAMGAFWDDNPGAVVETELTDAVAAINDSIPPTATPKERWQHVMRWLRWKLNL